MHISTGYIEFDLRPEDEKRFRPWWALLICDDGIVDYYCWLSRSIGRPIMQNKLWGAHISFVKGEIPPNMSCWNLDYGLIEFQYTHRIRYDNGCHAWLDVECEKLHQIRKDLGLPEYPHGAKTRRLSLHLTLGRWA